jgi:hypothetical protein
VLTFDIQIDVSIKDNDDGTYYAVYVAKTPGKFRLHVLVDGKPISGSTFHVEVNPGFASAEKSEIKGNFKLTHGKHETYVIITKDRNGNPCKVGGARIYLALVAADTDGIFLFFLFSPFSFSAVIALDELISL